MDYSLSSFQHFRHFLDFLDFGPRPSTIALCLFKMFGIFGKHYEGLFTLEMLTRPSSSFSMRPAFWAEKRCARTKAFIAARHCTALCFGCARARGVHTPASDFRPRFWWAFFSTHRVCFYVGTEWGARWSVAIMLAFNICRLQCPLFNSSLLFCSSSSSSKIII